LSWVVLVLLLILFIFGMSLTTGTTDFLEAGEFVADPRRALVVSWFGTVDRSILSLYQAAYGGRDWGDFSDALGVLPGMYMFLFLLYVSFSLLAVVNVITGIFVDSALQCNNNDREMVVSDEIERRKKFEASVRAVFQEMDQDGCGQISKTDFETGLNDDRVVAYFKSLKLEVGDAEKLFTLLDFDASGAIDVDEFLLGCQRLRGESRAYDQAVMQMEIRWLAEAINRSRTNMDMKFAEVRAMMPRPANTELLLS